MYHRSHPSDTGRRRLRSRLVGVALAFTLVAAACGGDDDAETAPDDPVVTTVADDPDAPDTTEAPDPDPDADAPETTTAPEPEPEPEPADEPTAGGDLIVGTVFDAFGLEPATFVGGVTDAHIALAIYDAIAMIQPDGSVEPWLAETIETDDFQTYDITLHEGVTFHDGTTLDAEAVKFNLERHQDVDTNSRALPNARHIESVTVTGDLSLEIVLAFPWAAFPELLAGSLGVIASPTAIEAGEINSTPVGSGPFVFESRIPQDNTVVVRNDDYWRDDQPYLDSITFRVMLDDNVRQTSVENGEIHAAQSIRADTLVAADGIDGVFATRTPGRVNTIQINSRTAPFDDVRVRQALAYSLDYDALNQVIFSNAANPIHHWISSDSPFFDPEVEWYDYDPERASQLIAEYEADGGSAAFTFRCYTEPSRVQLTELASQMWRAAGFDVTTDMSDQMSLVIDLFTFNYTVGCFSGGAETQDPDQLFYASLHSESGTNYGGYENAEMDAALDAGRTSADEDVRVDAYSTVQQLLADEVPIIQYMSSPWGWVVRDEIGGFETLPGAEFVGAKVYFRD